MAPTARKRGLEGSEDSSNGDQAMASKAKKPRVGSSAPSGFVVASSSESKGKNRPTPRPALQHQVTEEAIALVIQDEPTIQVLNSQDADAIQEGGNGLGEQVGEGKEKELQKGKTTGLRRITWQDKGKGKQVAEEEEVVAEEENTAEEENDEGGIPMHTQMNMLVLRSKKATGRNAVDGPHSDMREADEREDNSQVEEEVVDEHGENEHEHNPSEEPRGTSQELGHDFELEEEGSRYEEERQEDSELEEVDNHTPRERHRNARRASDNSRASRSHNVYARIVEATEQTKSAAELAIESWEDFLEAKREIVNMMKNIDYKNVDPNNDAQTELMRLLARKESELQTVQENIIATTKLAYSLRAKVGFGTAWLNRMRAQVEKYWEQRGNDSSTGEEDDDDDVVVSSPGKENSPQAIRQRIEARKLETKRIEAERKAMAVVNQWQHNALMDLKDQERRFGMAAVGGGGKSGDGVHAKASPRRGTTASILRDTPSSSSRRRSLPAGWSAQALAGSPAKPLYISSSSDDADDEVTATAPPLDISLHPRRSRTQQLGPVRARSGAARSQAIPPRPTQTPAWTKEEDSALMQGVASFAETPGGKEKWADLTKRMDRKRRLGEEGREVLGRWTVNDVKARGIVLARETREVQRLSGVEEVGWVRVLLSLRGREG